MIPLIAEKRQDIEALCGKFNVARLEVFGSATGERFDEACSDVDFIVEFRAGQELGPWLAHYFDFKTALESLLGRNVDLVMTGALKNPYFIREANKTRTLLYAA